MIPITNSFMDGFTVYYLHFTDTMEEQSHSFPLAHSLTPVVNFQNVKRTYLGLPYTPCTETFSTNNYTEVLILEQRRHQERKEEKPYKESICVFTALINKIIANCNCYLDYIDGIENYLPESHQLAPCNFLVHATCVSQLVDSFQWSEGKCLPACASYSFHQENIQYVKVSQNYLSTMRNKLGLPNNVAVTSMGNQNSDDCLTRG